MADEQKKSLEQAAIVAHQMKSPLGTLQSIVQTLLGGFAGDLTEKQKSMLQGADRKCSEAMETVRALLTLSEVRHQAPEDAAADLVQAAHRACRRYRGDASERNIRLTCDVEPQEAWVRTEQDPLTEAIIALVDNALTYTPEGGRVRMHIHLVHEEDRVVFSISDSGIGVPEDERDNLFTPFFRASNARQHEPAGTGLGLPFVKAVVDAAGGNISVGESEQGGAQFSISLPLRSAPGEAVPPREPSFRAVVIGGVAAGPKVAAKIKRMDPEAEVTIVERGRVLSYAGCGLPFYISGQITDQRELISTPEGILRGPEYFERVKAVHVMNRTEAIEIDREDKRVLVRNLVTGDESWLPYDKLAIATGARTIRPDIQGMQLDNIFALHGLEHAEGIRANLAEQRAKDVTIVGGGLIGVEMTESLVSAGCRVTLVEKDDQLLPNIMDRDMARLVRRHFEEHGVRVMLNTEVTGFEGETAVRRVISPRGSIPADMVILGTGVTPNVELARKAGLEIGETGALKVAPTMRTSDPDIYAAGDCVESNCIITGEPCYVPLGSTANKQGRVAAINICGGNEEFPGITSTIVCKMFDYTVARAGLTEKQAIARGHDVAVSLTPGLDRAHFMPRARFIVIKLIADAETENVLGLQVVGPGEAAKRVDVAVTAMTAGMKVERISKLDLCYAPSYSEALDNLHTACNVLRNKLSGQMPAIRAEEVHRKINSGEDLLLLDVRTQSEYEDSRIEGSKHIPLGSLRGRLSELPRNREIIVFSHVSLSGYEASIILRSHGFSDVKVMDGGIIMWPGGENI
jgi:NADPH-dependent 2,4-dienoyl-CoA reductase/sulfur reductase-like enzyme/rhodanese-related sulfurtransferase